MFLLLCGKQTYLVGKGWISFHVMCSQRYSKVKVDEDGTKAFEFLVFILGSIIADAVAAVCMNSDLGTKQSAIPKAFALSRNVSSLLMEPCS